MSKPTRFKFRLYVAGDGPNSVLAIANLREICQEHLVDRHDVEVVDVLTQPERALADFVLMTPLLVKLSPAPIQKLAGSLSQRSLVLQTIGLPT